MNYFKFSFFIICVFFSITTYGQTPHPLFNSASGYNSGLANIDVIGTSSNIQSATFSSPSRMFEKRMAAHLSYQETNDNRVWSNNNFSTAFHYSFDRFSVGAYHKQISVKGVYINNDVSDLGFTSSGIAGAYKLSKKWAIGVNLNLYTREITNFNVLINQNPYLTSGLSTTYQDKKILINNNEINWSFGVSINNFGAKQNGIFIPTQGKIGGTFGYLIALNPEKSSNLKFTLLYQTDKYLHPDNLNSDDSAFEGLFTSLWDSGNTLADELAPLVHRIGFEAFYTHKSSFNMGVKTANEASPQNSTNLFNIGLTLGFKGFYINSGYYSLYNTIGSSFSGSFGGELGYQLDF